MNRSLVKKLRLKFLLSGLLYILAMNLAAAAQESFNRTIVTDLTNKTAVSFEPQASSSTGRTVGSGFGNFRQLSQATAENRIVRLLIDETNAVIFGYELTVEQTASNKFRLNFAPLPTNFALPLFAGQKASLAGNRRKTILLTLPGMISDQAVDDADELTVNLLFHPQLKIRIADVIRVSAIRQKLEPPVEVPRELTLDDLKLGFKNLKLNLDDEPFAKLKGSRAAGSLVWFYLPNKGFFLLSLVPRTGYDFRRIGVIDNNKITFRSDGVKYEMISEQPILPFAGAWGLWVLHDPKYRPPFLAPVDETEQMTVADDPPKPPKEPKIKIKKDGSIEVKTPDDNAGFDEDRAPQPIKKAPILLRDLQLGTVTKIENILPKN